MDISCLVCISEETVAAWHDACAGAIIRYLQSHPRPDTGPGEEIICWTGSEMACRAEWGGGRIEMAIPASKWSWDLSKGGKG